MTKTVAYTFRMDPDVKADLEGYAKADERSLAIYINRVLRKHRDERRAAEAKPSAKTRDK